MRPRISIRGCVRPSVRRSVRPLVGPSVRRSVPPSVRNAFVKIAENGVMQDEGASRAVYPALFFSALTTHSQTSSILSIFGRFSLHTFKNRPCTCHGFFYYTLNISQSMCILIFLAVCEAKIGFFSNNCNFRIFRCVLASL